MVYGESGANPIKIDIQTRIVSFWIKLLNFNTGRLSSMMYNIIYLLHEQGKCKSKWLENVKSLVMNNGHANIWLNQSCIIA